MPRALRPAAAPGLTALVRALRPAAPSRLPAVVLVALACAGCGGSAASAVPAASPPSAQQLLADSSSALARVRSYRISGMLDPGLAVDLVVLPDAVSGTMSSNGVSWNLIVVSGAVWIRGRALWAATLAPARAAALGDGWVRVTDPAAAFGHARILPTLPRAVPAVIFGPHPGLAVTGPSTVGGRSAIELRGPSDVYDVASDGPPYPLRWLDRDIPGPGGAPCGVVLSDFGATVAVTPPAAVVGAVTPRPVAP